MNQREKILAIAVGGLIAVFAAIYGWQVVGGWISTKSERLASLKQQLSDEQFQLQLGMQTVDEIKQLEKKSLPGDIDVARSLYQQRLLEVATDHQLEEIDVSAITGTQRGRGYQQLSFKLKGRGDLRQVTRLLYKFYRSDSLQRIRYLSLKPIRDSKKLDLDVTLEALVLDGADPAETLPAGIDREFEQKSLEAYLDEIVGRNIFSRANNPPLLAAVRESTYPGEPVRVELRGRDDDELDNLRYELIESPDSSASVDPESGTFSWHPRETGDYVFKVSVTDDGLPARTAEAEVRVAVRDRPPPPEPRERPAPPPKEPDDDVKNTYVTAITGSGGVPSIWFSVRTTGETLKVALGEKFDIGNFRDMEVKHINDKTVEVFAEGRQWLLSLGDSFADAAEIPEEGL